MTQSITGTYKARHSVVPNIITLTANLQTNKKQTTIFTAFCTRFRCLTIAGPNETKVMVFIVDYRERETEISNQATKNIRSGKITPAKIVFLII